MLDLTRNIFETLRSDQELVLYRGRSIDDASQVLMLSPASVNPSPAIVRRLEHEFSLRETLDPAWSAPPVAVTNYWDRPVLLLRDPGGVPLDQLLGRPLALPFALRLAINLSSAIDELHRCGVIHKDIKPANVLVNSATGQCWLTGFGICSSLPREHQSAEPPEFVAGTLAYMAPEQTGRMNRSIDSRSDLYSLGVTLYQMLTGTLPFTASDPMEWVHCHIARQAAPANERSKNVPTAVSAIIDKLLAKTAEERYQTASGVKNDLERCLDAVGMTSWSSGVSRASGSSSDSTELAEVLPYEIPEFPLGERDIPERLLMPEKLYGRTREIDTLLLAFERVASSGRPELVLVSGYSGIGKSSVVHELHKVLVPRGLFASGKFDQFARDIPYATLAQAFQSLIRPLLSKSDAELLEWRNALREALGPNGKLIVELVPELKLIIGDEPPIPDLSPQDTQRRFQFAFRQFISVFARREQPLVLFLDDLQWLDTATLDLLEDLLTSGFTEAKSTDLSLGLPATVLMADENSERASGEEETRVRWATQPQVKHLLLIGAYRDNEVSSTHPLMRRLEAIRQAGAVPHEIVLSPLTQDDVVQLTADSLRSQMGRVSGLAQLIHEKTAGNPFFAIQFISALADEGLLTFARGEAQWCWELDGIHAKGYTDNVVDLMVGKLNRLPFETRRALQQLACLGNVAEVGTISIVHDASEEDVHAALWEATRAGLVLRSGGAYRFIHDRVQEAAYSLIPEDARAETHLRIGRLLAENTSTEEREESIFEIVKQFNRGSALITSRDEREQLAELNLTAGRRAMVSTAYASARQYLIAGAGLLADDAWERRRELAFGLELHRAECDFLTGELAVAEERLVMLSSRAATVIERAAVACLLMDLYTTVDQSDRAVRVCLNYLQHLGLEWSPHPSPEEARREYELIWSRLGSRSIEELIDMPLMVDPMSLATLDVLTKAFPPALHTDANLLSLVTCRAVNLSLKNGNSDASCVAYVLLAKIAGPYFENYQAGFQFGRLGYDLVEQRGLTRMRARTYLWFSEFVMPWTDHIRKSRDLTDQALEAAYKTGDLTLVAFSCDYLNTNLLAAGDPLANVQREAENGLEFAQKAKFGHVVAVIRSQLGLVRSLRGFTRQFGSFDDEEFDELKFQNYLANITDVLPKCWYWLRKLQSRFLAGDYGSAIEAALRAEQLLWTTSSNFEMAEYHLYSALALAAVAADSSSVTKQGQLRAMGEHYKQLALWAQYCPENFENRVALVGAEIARLEGREIDAMRLYERAIHSANANGFVHNEALASELAGRFCLNRGFERIARAYLRDARYGYLRWGADGKIRQLEQLYPFLREDRPARSLADRGKSATANTIEVSSEYLAFATVIRALQAISGEIVLESLIDTLMRAALEHAGADRGLLLLSRASELRVQAEAATADHGIIVALVNAFTEQPAAPQSIINYVVRTQEAVILDDAQVSLSTDNYINEEKPRSILCLPLINQAKLTGVLYLENKLTPNVFTPARISVLKLLASQAAISLENTRLYHDLEAREAKIRRLVDANIIGIHIWNLEGEIVEANEAFLRMLGYSRADLVSGHMRWTELTPVEWIDRDRHAVTEIVSTGIFQPFEKEYFHKDGSRVPVLMGGAIFEGGGSEGVAFVLDLSRQKRAEEALQTAQTELAHASRVMTMGELTASIAHEISQPISAVITNANVGLRWLVRDVPDLEETAQAIRRIRRDGERAGAVLSRMRALFKKAPTAKERLDINEVIQEVLTITQHELQRHRVLIRTQFADDLPPVTADRIQLQQVILNLVVNAIQAMSAVPDCPRELQLASQTTDGSGAEGANDFDAESHSKRPAQVLVTIRDSGPGLNPERLHHLFDPFFSTKPQGLGIGLTISRSIIEAHGGRLWAKANEPQGAIFQFTLPVELDR
ncbi:MAG: AAA family ATPase [Verrucomicrobia bacterium]|nr:AAA family ATPase [Verrucomicrobiota bacterium]MBV8417667.1 AAA family ATPase [Verrucomicrobiota bacterium]